ESLPTLLWAEYRREWQPQQRERRERDWQEQKQREQERRAELRRRYQAERRAIQNDSTKKAPNRKAALSLVRMEKVRRDLTLREQIEAERTELKARYGMKPTDQYRAFLAERAGRGDADALAELRRQRVAQPQPTTRERIEDREGRDPETAPIRKLAAPAGYKVDRDGNVTYYDQERRAMFTDTGPAVEFSQTERDALETGLRLALVKFGPAIRLRGGDEAFRHAMADVAADKGLYVEFSDKDLQDRYEQRREEIKAGRTYVAQPERTKPAHGGQGRTAEQEQERGQEPRQPRNTDRSR
ncbi:LPD7 domain-containing protein, partial [Xanthomonas axonopodis]|uniref:LPD7 domain-containing protein n=1 Tax=Xanthomonas axonopodis TaxID=53413 RepID=UPI001C4E2A80